MENFTKIGMPVLVVLFLLVAAISITITVTKENTLKQVAAAANTPVGSLETQLARTPQPQTYAVSEQPGVSTPGQSTLSAPANDYSYDTETAQASCHGSGTQVSGSATVYTGGGCGGCRGNTGRLSGPTTGSGAGASCH